MRGRFAQPVQLEPAHAPASSAPERAKAGPWHAPHRTTRWPGQWQKPGAELPDRAERPPTLQMLRKSFPGRDCRAAPQRQASAPPCALTSPERPVPCETYLCCSSHTLSIGPYKFSSVHRTGLWPRPLRRCAPMSVAWKEHTVSGCEAVSSRFKKAQESV